MSNYKGKLIFDKDDISKKIQMLLNSKQSFINLESDDFKYLPKCLIEYDIDYGDDNYSLNYPHLDFQPLDIVLSISSGNNLCLEECNNVMKSLFLAYGGELNIIYGYGFSSRFCIYIFVVN